VTGSRAAQRERAENGVGRTPASPRRTRGKSASATPGSTEASRASWRDDRQVRKALRVWALATASATLLAMCGAPSPSAVAASAHAAVTRLAPQFLVSGQRA
jgi:hypothetical protein